MNRPHLFLRCLLAGLAAALVASFASWLYDVVMDLIGFSFVPFSIAGHLVILGILNVLGIIPLYLIGRFVKQPMPAYYTLALMVAIALSILVTITPPWSVGFTLYAAVPGFLLCGLISAVVATQIAYRGDAVSVETPPLV